MRLFVLIDGAEHILIDRLSCYTLGLNRMLAGFDTKEAWALCTFAYCEGPGAEPIDLVITLGGDGTILHASSLFKVGAVPPVLSFSMGTLGFLLPFRESYILITNLTMHAHTQIIQILMITQKR